MIQSIVKRDGRVVLYDESKIARAVLKALEAAEEGDAAEAARVTNKASKQLELMFKDESPTIEQIQDVVERSLMETGHDEAAKKYICLLYTSSPFPLQYTTNRGRAEKIWAQYRLLPNKPGRAIDGPGAGGYNLTKRQGEERECSICTRRWACFFCMPFWAGVWRSPLWR